MGSMTRKEFIAKWYYLISVELSEPIHSDELYRILECDIELEVFEKWLDEMSDQGIKPCNERQKFYDWLRENNLEHIWNYKHVLGQRRR